MKILSLTEDQIQKYRIDSQEKFILLRALRTHPKVKAIFRWCVQCWVLTTDNKKLPVKKNAKSPIVVRFEDVVNQTE